MPASLASAAARGGMIYGAAASTADLDDAVTRAALLRECGAITPEYEMKWNAIEPTRDVRRFGSTDRLLQFAQDHGLAFRGHTPWWHLSMPPWLDGAAAGTFGDAALSYLVAVATRYAGHIHSWDVVNEPLAPEHGRPDGLRRSPFLDAFGPRYVVEAFMAVAAIDQAAILTLNEAGLEHDGAEAAAKRRAMLRLLERSLACDAPIGALGLQCHLAAGETPAANADFRCFLREARALGVSVLITELDVDCAGVRGDETIGDHAAARVYEDIVQVVAEEADLIGVVTWGVSDRRSWLNDRPELPPGHGLPLDLAGRRKAAWCSLAGSLMRNAAPSR